MSDKEDERRQYPRAPVKVEILCEELEEQDRRGKGVLCFYSTDISIGGIFLETTVPFDVGSTIHLKFHLPGVEREIKVAGKVVRTNEKNSSLLPGVGIEFDHLGFDVKKAIEGYVSDTIADQL